MSNDDTTPFDPEEPKRAWCKAMGLACAEMQALVAKAGRNSHGGYAYVGHQHVLEATRASALNHGIFIGAPLTVAPPMKLDGGKYPVYVWSFVIPVYHTEGHVEHFQVQATTQLNDKAAFVASTAADRTLRLRLFGLGGGEAEDPEHDSHDKAAKTGGSPF